jgi:hypothetical protein
MPKPETSKSYGGRAPTTGLQDFAAIRPKSLTLGNNLGSAKYTKSWKKNFELLGHLDPYS